MRHIRRWVALAAAITLMTVGQPFNVHPADAQSAAKDNTLRGKTADGITKARLKPVRTLIGLSLPPYIIQSEQRGMEYDIVKESFANAGYRMVPLFVPFGRVPTAIMHGQADSAMTVNQSLGLPLCYSDPDITYQNFAITLASRHIKIDSVADLKGKSVRAFQNAQIYLGPAFKAAVAGNPDYVETPNQETQNLMLYAGRIQVSVGDRNIFNWYRKTVAKDVDTSQKLVFHPIFPPTLYGVGFRDPALCQAYDRGLRALRTSGRYDAIVAEYSGQ